MSEAIRPLAIVEDYDGLVEAIGNRVIELKVTYDSVDYVAGLCKGWTNKVVAGGTNPIKRLGMASLGPILQTLGLKLLVVEDEEAFARIRPRLAQRKTTRPCEREPASATAPPG
jgi:hypothetical protein